MEPALPAFALAVVVLLATLGLAGMFGVFWLRERAEATQLRSKYGGIDDVTGAVERLRVEQAGIERELAARREAATAEASRLKASADAEVAASRAALASERERAASEMARLRASTEAEISTRRAAFDSKYAAAVAELERLTKEVGLYTEQAELQSFGLYRPRYDFGTPDQYKKKLEEVWESQAFWLKSKAAATCGHEWTVGGDKREGKKMVDRTLKLMLRAFNGECDSVVAKVKFNNAVAMEQRIEKAFEAINEAGAPTFCSITPQYRDLKLAELHLTHELAEKVQAEKEEQRRIRDQMRDEEQARREMEKAQRDAEAEERRREQALAKARADLEAAATEAKRQAMEQKVADLETALAAAHAQTQRAISQAQLTKRGHIYVISNPGSFGDDVFKVGMTRRLEPLDRIRELGDASVPFDFDVHAIIFSEDAPGLESALHRALTQHRVNLVNERKEFFRASIEHIETIVRQHASGEVTFERIAVAEEWRKTLALVQDRASSATPDAVALGEGGVVAKERDRLAALRQQLADE